jgi:hypothetical protein
VTEQFRYRAPVKVRFKVVSETPFPSDWPPAFAWVLQERDSLSYNVVRKRSYILGKDDDHESKKPRRV